jgi:hypothetical protein
MRTVLLLLLALLAAKTTGTTSATAQNACSKPYVACMDKCVTKPSKMMQDACIESCQNQAKVCFSGRSDPNVQTVRETNDRPDSAVGAASAAKAATSAKPIGQPQQTVAKPQQPAQRRAQ